MLKRSILNNNKKIKCVSFWSALALKLHHFLSDFWTYINFTELLLHLVQFVLLAGSREQSGGIAALHSIDLNGRLEGQRVRHDLVKLQASYAMTPMISQTKMLP